MDDYCVSQKPFLVRFDNLVTDDLCVKIIYATDSNQAWEIAFNESVNFVGFSAGNFDIYEFDFNGNGEMFIKDSLIEVE